MNVVWERLHGAVIGFIIAQFVTAWVSYPLCVLAIVAYAGAPMVQAERLRSWFTDGAVRMLPRFLAGAAAQAPPPAAQPLVVETGTTETLEDFWTTG